MKKGTTFLAFLFLFYTVIAIVIVISIRDVFQYKEDYCEWFLRDDGTVHRLCCIKNESLKEGNTDIIKCNQWVEQEIVWEGDG